MPRSSGTTASIRNQVTVEQTPFGELLRGYRVAAGLSQEALAERARMSVRAVSDLERGVRRRPYRDTVAQLAAALELHGVERAALQEAARARRAPRSTAAAAAPAGRRDETLLATKLAPPPVRTTRAARPRLIERLHAELQGPLTLLSAPPGSGKTTLLSDWRATPAGGAADLAWVSLDAGDNDPVRFWSYVFTALDRLHPGVGAPALALLQPSPAARRTLAAPGQAALTALVNALNAVPSDVILALDDYHEITAQEVHQGLTFLLNHRPPCLHLLIATRTDPPLPLAQLRARGAVAELRAADLRFTEDEAAAFLTEVMGLPLTAEAVAALEARTEGWIAGLQLAALSLQGRPAEGMMPFIAAFTGSHRYVVDYLMDEVLRRQPEEVQAFLLRTCILDRLCAPLCAALVNGDGAQTGNAGASQALLEQLERDNVFIVPLDDERRWYRYHQLFADALRQRLSGSGDPDAALLHRRAAAWFERQGLPQEAIGHALAAGDDALAADLIEHIAFALVVQGEVQTLRAWLDALPERVWRARPRLCVVQAWLVLDIHTVDQVERYARDAAEALDAATPAGDTNNTRGEIAATWSIVAALRGDPARVIDCAREALDLLDRDNAAMRGVAFATLGSAYVGLGDLARAEQVLGAGADAARRAGNAALALTMTEDQTHVQRAQGQLRLAVATCRQALAWNSARGAGASPFASGVELSLADLLREWNDLEGAAQQIDAAFALPTPLAPVSLQVLRLLILARIRRAQGDLDGALHDLREARGYAQPHRDSVPMALFAAILEACEAQVWLAQGDMAAALNWLQRPDRLSDTTIAEMSAQLMIHAYEHITVAPVQVLIAQGRSSGDPAPLESALELLEQQYQEPRRMALPWRHIKARVLQAVAYQTLGDLDRAMAALDEALVRAAPERYVRLFADEGPPLAPLLARALDPAHAARLATQRGVPADYLHTMLAACGADPAASG